VPVAEFQMHSAVFMPLGSPLARNVERMLPARGLVGGLVILIGRKC
jgi:hypothetical protein